MGAIDDGHFDREEITVAVTGKEAQSAHEDQHTRRMCMSLGDIFVA